MFPLPLTTQPKTENVLETREIRLLLEIGYMAAGHGLVESAEAIFAGLGAARPQSPYPDLGRALSLINSGKFAEAVSQLRRVALPKDPRNEWVRAFLALALQLDHRHNEALAVREELLRESRNPDVHQMVTQLGHEMSPTLGPPIFHRPRRFAS